MPRRGDVKESFEIIKAMLTGKEEPPSRKFLAEQRLAYAFIGFSIVLLIATGMLKFMDNLPTVSLSFPVVFWNTMLHNIGTMLFLFGFIAHIGAFLLKANWPLFRSMFNGKVSLKYAEHRHPIWIEEIKSGEATKGHMASESIVRLVAGVMVGTGVLLGAIAHPAWYLLPVFVALNMIQSSFTKWCIMENLLRKLGYR